ncbi:MAG TPA: hypothetical protein VJH95_00690 [Candidatus Nanoarchaeia archaeon]|nr:hypothetical protein [Candidatus Nanoarchaeia archaeon]
MGEIDYVVPRVSVEWNGKLDLKEVYTFIKGWLVDKKYDLAENEYSNTETEEGNILHVRWWAFKKIDDYSKFNIDVIFTGKKLKVVNAKKHVLIEGDINIDFESYIERDYENVWGVRPGQRFIREVMDKFFLKGRFDKYHEELREETLTLREEIKKHLNALDYK